MVCIEDHKYQPHNFWNGRWRSQWTLEASGSVAGKLWVHVHYYEDGNVQLQSTKDVEGNVAITDPDATAKKFFKLILDAENDYQVWLSASLPHGSFPPPLCLGALLGSGSGFLHLGKG